jgi:Family of unknown function (DUF6505)
MDVHLADLGAIIGIVKLLKTVRADTSDTFVFGHAAAPGEWAVSGAFAFAQFDPAALHGKARAEFRAGFLGLSSLGRSTLVQVVDVDARECMTVTELLAQQLIDRFGAPDWATAHAAAQEEIAFAAELGQHPAGRLIAVSRRYEEGALREVFRTLTPRQATGPIRVFALQQQGVDGDVP